MVLMYSFAFWFSTRFGSLVVATFTLIQSMAGLVSCILGLENQDKIQMQIGDWLQYNDLRFMTETVQEMKRDTESYLTGFIIFFSFHCFSCFLLIYGALRVTLWCVYPFLLLEFVRLVFITVVFIIAMLLVKENILNLGFLISCCLGGGFVLLFLFYLWFCVLSFIQIVKELELVYKMGNYQGGKINMQEYQRMNAPEIGSEYFPRGGGFMPASSYRRNYNMKYMNDKINTRFAPDNDYTHTLARAVY